MTDKEQVLKVLERLPDDATLAEIRYEIDVLAMLKERMADVRAGGKTISHEEVKQRLKKWLE